MLLILTKYVLTAAYRDKLLLGFLGLLLVGTSVSLFLGSSAITESDQFSLIFAGSSLRIAGNLALILFVVFYLRRSFEARDVEYLLSRPISKFQFLLAHGWAFIILSFLAALLVTLFLVAMPISGITPPYFLWGMSLWVEFCIMVLIAMFFSLALSSAVTASLASFAFYIMARLIGDILGIIEAAGNSGAYALMEKTMLVISVFIPRLDMMAQSSWLLYGVSEEINLLFILLQGTIFSVFVFSAAWLDLNKRQF